MNTAVTLKTQKLIERPNDVCRRLSIHAASMGTSVKKLIENMVIESLSEYDDDSIYRWLCQTQPEGGEMISEDRQEELIKSLKEKLKRDEI